MQKAILEYARPTPNVYCSHALRHVKVWVNVHQVRLGVYLILNCIRYSDHLRQLEGKIQRSLFPFRREESAILVVK